MLVLVIRDETKALIGIGVVGVPVQESSQEVLVEARGRRPADAQRDSRVQFPVDVLDHRIADAVPGVVVVDGEPLPMTVGVSPQPCLVRLVEELDVADRGIASLVRGESVVQDPPALVRVVKS